MVRLQQSSVRPQNHGGKWGFVDYGVVCGEMCIQPNLHLVPERLRGCGVVEVPLHRVYQLH